MDGGVKIASIPASSLEILLCFERHVSNLVAEEAGGGGAGGGDEEERVEGVCSQLGGGGGRCRLCS